MITLFFYSVTPGPRNTVVTFMQLWEIIDDVGNSLHEVGLLPGIPLSKIYFIDEEFIRNSDKAMTILIEWKQQEGRNATVGRLADVLEKVGRKDIAELLLTGE